MIRRADRPSTSDPSRDVAEHAAVHASTDLVVDAFVRRGDFVLDASLRVEAGSTVALVGPNGAGKSTMLAAVAGLVALDTRSDAGEPGPPPTIRLGDRVLDDPASSVFVEPERRRIAMVFQDLRLFDHLDVLGNVAFGRRALGARRAEAEAAASPLVESLGLADLSDRRPAQLSGGQAQRVAVARALATDPAALLFDEPLSALDVATRAATRRLVHAHLGGFAGPRIVVTHDPSDAFTLADRVVVLEEGRITQDAPTDEIRRRPATPYVAALSGVNLVRGTASGGRVMIDDAAASGGGRTGVELTVASTEISGPVRCTVAPSAVVLSNDRPAGSQRNVWETSVDSIEATDGTNRIVLGAPLPLAVDVTAAAVADLGLAPGVPVWAAVKATEIDVARA